jgi:hypothetical protein
MEANYNLRLATEMRKILSSDLYSTPSKMDIP